MATKYIYILHISPMANGHKVLAFTDKELAYDTYNKAIDRFKALHPTCVMEGNTPNPDGNVTIDFRWHDGRIIETMKIEVAPLMSEIYPQVATDYYDEWTDRQAVDAWPTTDECDENGRTVANVNPQNKTIEYTEDTRGENCINVFNAIEDLALEWYKEEVAKKNADTIVKR